MSRKDRQKPKELTPQEVEDNFKLLLSGEFNEQKLISGFAELVSTRVGGGPDIFRKLSDYADQASKKALEQPRLDVALMVAFFKGQKDAFNRTADILEKPAAPPKPADQLQMTDPKK